LEGHVRAFDWWGGVPRECVYDNLRSAVAKRDGDVVVWSPRFVRLRGHYAFHATACTPATQREKGSVEGAVRHTKTGFWPARRFVSLAELDELYADWRDRVSLPRRHATGRHIVAERLEVEREALRPLPPIAFDAAGRRTSRVPIDGYLKHAGSFYRAPETLVHQRVELRFDRDRVWIEHRGQTVARYPRSYVAGSWQPAPKMRPEPPAVAPAIPIAVPELVPPALSDYAELCA
jgi:Mu transposase, C-terminal domain